MIVVVDTPVCPSCTSKLVAWSKEAGLACISGSRASASDTFLAEFCADNFRSPLSAYTAGLPQSAATPVPEVFAKPPLYMEISSRSLIGVSRRAPTK